MKAIKGINLVFRGITFDNWNDEKGMKTEETHHWSGICQK